MYIDIYMWVGVQKFIIDPRTKIRSPYSLDRTTYIYIKNACGIMVIVVGNGHGDTSSNPGRD